MGDSDSGPPPYASDRDSRPPRKHRYDQRNGRSDRHSEDQDGYSSERTQNRNERSHNRHRDRDQYHEDRKAYRPREEPNRSQHYEERGPSRQQRDRGRDGHRERDHHYEDRGPSRNQTERSRDRYQDRDHYSSERSYNQYQGREGDQKERSRDRFDERERRQEYSKPSSDRQGYPAENKRPEHYYPSERYPPSESQMYDMEYSPEPEGGILDCHKCRYLCTGRACCQLVEVLLNMLILICCSVSYNSTGGYTGITNMGGIYYYQFGGAYSLSGAEGVKAQELDVQFYNLKLPTVTASMAIGGAVMVFSCLMVLLGVLRVPWRWPVCLLVESALDVAIAVGYIPALYFYFQRLQEAYNSQVCKDREELYKSKGYQGFSCALHGADIAAALFACMAIIAFILSAWLAIKGFRSVRRMKKKPVDPLQF